MTIAELLLPEFNQESPRRAGCSRWCPPTGSMTSRIPAILVGIG